MPFYPDGTSSERDSSPDPLLNSGKHPKDTAQASGAKQLRTAFKKLLDDYEDRFMNVVSHASTNTRTIATIYGQILHYLWLDCRGVNGILNTTAKLGVFKSRMRRDWVYNDLASFRMMQLNLAGDRDYETTWCESLELDNKRLATLVFGSNHGTDSWAKFTIETKEDVCRACLSMGQEPNMKAIRDKVTELPCSHRHTIHTSCVAKWTKRSKHCPDCGEYIL